MKIFLSIIILGSLALLIKKFGAKNIAKEIEEKAAEAAAAIKHITVGESEHHTDNETKKDTTHLDTDKASLASLQNDAGNKDLLKRTGILQAQNKWGVKDENGFYYSVDSSGVLFSGGNSTDEYNTMLQQQTDYNTKVAALTKTITDETKQVEEGMGGVHGLEIPLQIKLMLAAIKSKFSVENADEEGDNGNENNNSDNDDADYHNNYNGGNNSGGDNGGGGGSNNNNPYPFGNTVLPSAVVTTPATSVIPTGQTLANILNQPFTMSTLHPRINLSPFNITPTPTPVINNPVIANMPASSERQAQPVSQRHSGHHFHNHRRH